MLKIGITGNIASGKSLFEKYLKSFGYKVLCLDAVTHSLYENSNILKKFLLKKFNTTLRSEISSILFKDSNSVRLKKELENFIYPLILDEMNKFFIEYKDESLLFVSGALLFESGFYKYFDKIILITANKDIRLKRLIERNNITKDEAMKRIEAQMDENLKISRADFVVKNTGSPELLKNSVNEIIKALNIP